MSQTKTYDHPLTMLVVGTPLGTGKLALTYGHALEDEWAHPCSSCNREVRSRDGTFGITQRLLTEETLIWDILLIFCSDACRAAWEEKVETGEINEMTVWLHMLDRAACVFYQDNQHLEAQRSHEPD